MEPGLANLIFIGFLILIFYFFLIRPQKKRVDAHRQLISSVHEGDEIVTVGGVYGTVRRLGDDDIDLEVSPGTTIRIVKSAIARRVTEDVEDEATESGEENLG